MKEGVPAITNRHTQPSGLVAVWCGATGGATSASSQPRPTTASPLCSVPIHAAQPDRHGKPEISNGCPLALYVSMTLLKLLLHAWAGHPEWVSSYCNHRSAASYDVPMPWRFFCTSYRTQGVAPTACHKIIYRNKLTTAARAPARCTRLIAAATIRRMDWIWRWAPAAGSSGSRACLSAYLRSHVADIVAWHR